MCPGAHITALPIVKLVSSQFVRINCLKSLDGFSQFMKTLLVLKPFLSFKNHLPRFKGLLSQDDFPNSPVIITPFCTFITFCVSFADSVSFWLCGFPRSSVTPVSHRFHRLVYGQEQRGPHHKDNKINYNFLNSSAKVNLAP